MWRVFTRDMRTPKPMHSPCAHTAPLPAASWPIATGDISVQRTLVGRIRWRAVYSGGGWALCHAPRVYGELSVTLFVCLSVCMCVKLSVCLCVCVSVCLCVFLPSRPDRHITHCTHLLPLAVCVSARASMQRVCVCERSRACVHAESVRAVTDSPQTVRIRKWVGAYVRVCLPACLPACLRRCVRACAVTVLMPHSRPLPPSLPPSLPPLPPLSLPSPAPCSRSLVTSVGRQVMVEEEEEAGYGGGRG